MKTLESAKAPLSISDIAGQLGVHPNTVRFHLKTLVDNGRVERVAGNHRAPGRPPQLFRMVSGMDTTGPRHYQLLAEILAETLTADPDPAGRAAAAGRAWGRRQSASHYDAQTPGEAIGRLVTLLEELGFAPERDFGDGRPAGSTTQIRLRHCPFLELAEQRPQIACPIHLGLMQGAMDAWQSPIKVDRLEAFVEPDRCVAHLAGVGTRKPTTGEPVRNGAAADCSSIPPLSQSRRPLDGPTIVSTVSAAAPHHQ